ncbi:hypothetical protein [Xylanimonas protaetiae]|nr:hypothetical protein [Xylanimonas protaetiae]
MSKQSGEQCKRAAIVGGVTCSIHGSGTKAARAAAARRVEEAKAAEVVRTLGLPVDITPTDALLEEVRWTAGHVQWLRAKVQELDESQRDGDDGEHQLVWGTTKVKTGGDDFGTTQEAKPSIWYVLYEAERKHLVAVCSAALKAGVEERKVRLAEQQGDLVALVIRRILDALDLTPEQQALVPQVVPAQLRLIAGGAA